MTDAIAVVGAGACGLAAAWRLHQNGKNVVLIESLPGETQQTSGAWDMDPWVRGMPSSGSSRPFPTAGLSSSLAVSEPELLGEAEDVRRFAQELDLYVLGADERPIVPTGLGILRPTDGVGLGILNLAKYAGATVGVVEVGRFDFDAAWLARSFQEQAWSQETHTKFVAVEMTSVFEMEERDLPLTAFSRILDEEARLQRAVSDRKSVV